MPIFIINSDLTATADTPKPVKGTLSKAEYRDKLKAWSHRNKYYIDEDFLHHNSAPGDLVIGQKVEGELRNGILHIKKIAD